MAVEVFANAVEVTGGADVDAHDSIEIIPGVFTVEQAARLLCISPDRIGDYTHEVVDDL